MADEPRTDRDPSGMERHELVEEVLRVRRELDTMREVAQGNKRHVAYLTELMERSDLPVGQQSKRSSCCTECDDFEARVRADVAEELRPVVEKAIKDWAVMYPIPANFLAQGREEILAGNWASSATSFVFEELDRHTGKGLPGHAAALPDVVGTRIATRVAARIDEEQEG